MRMQDLLSGAPAFAVYGLPWGAVPNSDALDTGALPWRARKPRESRGFLSPSVRAHAAELGVDPRTLSGTGADGRVTRADVVGAATQVGSDEIVPFNNIRKRAATALIASKQTSPHALTAVVADYSRIDAVRSRVRAAFRDANGFSLTYLPFVARAVVDALREYRLMNATVAPTSDASQPSRAVHLGIAVDLDFEGLVVPVIRNADGLRLEALARAINEVATRARAKKLTADDLAGGTFTITNPGASGTWISFPIINQPQVGILATDGVSKQVVADEEGRMGIAPLGHLCLTFDHRAVDGAYAGAFVARVREIVETRDWSEELTLPLATPGLQRRLRGTQVAQSRDCSARVSRRGS
jgi:2-oxoglutarate dehydrogenase E2 component (dihydrolipoamide succinyltransferase)